MSSKQIQPLKPPEEPKNASEQQEEENEDEKKPEPLATVGEVFSFAQGSRVKLYIALGLFCAVINGLTYPGKFGCS